jgi:predicted phage terminase large subunit-like protein
MTLPFLAPADWSMADVVWGFSESYLVRRYDEPKPIPGVHREWWALCLSDYPQVAIAAPRGHAKSSAITFAYVLFVLLERLESHLLLIGSNEDLASAFVHDIKTELNENEALRADYGIEKLVKETETELIVRLAGGHKFRVIAKGAGQRMRGLKWERKRPGMVVFDDMEDEEMVINEQRRDKFRRWFYGTVRPILSGGGKIRGVGTIIGFDSLLERMMPPEKSPETVIEPLRTYSKRPKAWASVKYRAHSHDFSSVLWPQQKNAAQLQKIRAEYAGMGMLDTYGQEYLNDPIDQGTAYFRQQDFLAMRPQDFETRKTYYAAADLAIGETERNAYTAIVVGGLDSEGFLNIVDVRRERLDGEQIIEEMFSVHSRWDTHIFRLESENIEKAIGPFLYRKMDETGIYLPIDAKAPTKDKDKRARSIQARMRAGKVRFNKDADWYAPFEEELLKYPKFPYKDQVDAFAWLGLMLEEMVEPPSDKELEEDEYRESYEAHFPHGRCETTGY